MVATLWDSHLMFLESAATAREIRATVAKLAAEMRQFRDVIFAYSLGNEIRPDLIRWYGMRRVSRFLAELYDIGKNLDPEGLLPIPIIRRRNISTWDFWTWPPSTFTCIRKAISAAT